MEEVRPKKGEESKVEKNMRGKDSQRFGGATLQKMVMGM